MLIRDELIKYLHNGIVEHAQIGLDAVSGFVDGRDKTRREFSLDAKLCRFNMSRT